MNNRPDDALFAHYDSRLQQRGDTVRGIRGSLAHIRGCGLHRPSDCANSPRAPLRATGDIGSREPA